MYDFDNDDNYEVGNDEGYVDQEKTITRFKQLGSSLLSDIVHPSENFKGAGYDARQNQRAFKRWFKKQRDPKYAFWLAFEIVYGALKLDAWDGTMTLGGSPRTVSQLVHGLEKVLEIICPLSSEQLTRKITESFSSFNPVQEYLYSLKVATDEDVEMFQNMAKKLFGDSQDQRAEVKLTRWLIGAVARALEPGVKMDTALVIRGKQGVGKTTLLEALFGKYFRTLHSDKNATEQQRILQQAWCCELGEIEATFRTKDISALKAFLTETKDSFRAMYKDLEAPKPRHCVFAGTTNEIAFLNDPTGSRRFWIIDVDNHRIPVGWVKEHRDRIWAVALKFYKEQEQHWLTDDEDDLNDAYNKAFQSENSFVGALAPFLSQYELNDAAAGKGIAVSISEVMTTILEIKPESHKRNSKEVSNALVELGYTKQRLRNKQASGYYYYSANATDPCVLALHKDSGGIKVESANWASAKERKDHKVKLGTAD
jgi:hypothetical protein